MALLHIQNLRKSFRAPDGSAHEVIAIDHFELADGEERALAGESGSGKSTFLNLIAGILTPDHGSIVVDGRDVTALTEPARDRWRALTLGYVFQSLSLLSGYSCLENVLLAMAFGRGVDRPRAEALLQRVDLGHRLHHRPRQLSAGQQQRVAVARALANRPRLVLADEPTGSLDSRLADDTLTLIRETCREAGAALLLVSHDRDILRQFPRVNAMAEVNRATPLAQSSP